MILLDTDHLSVLQIPSSERRTRLVARMALASGEDLGTTIVSVEEQMRGWLAAIAKERLVGRQVAPYRDLGRLFAFFRAFSWTTATVSDACRNSPIPPDSSGTKARHHGCCRDVFRGTI